MLELLCIMLVCGIIASLIGQRKNIGPIAGFVMGALLGLIGIAIITLLPSSPKPMRSDDDQS